MAAHQPPAEAPSGTDFASLPVDSDVDRMGPDLAGKSHPIHLHPGLILLVMAGGCFGALARYGMEKVLPAPAGWPLPTLLVNIAGAFALGALLEGLSRRGPDTGGRRLVRLCAGTGFMGAFTTYSSLAVDSVHLFNAGTPGSALLYLAVSLLGGLGAVVAGIWVAAWHHRTAVDRASGQLVGAERGGEK